MTGGFIVAAAVPVGSSVAVPVLYCDNVHCDADGLEAMARGDVVKFASSELTKHISKTEHGYQIKDLKFTLKRTVRLQVAPGVTWEFGLTSCEYKFEPHADYSTMVSDGA